MPRSIRNTLQRRCDQAKNNVDNTLHHLIAMYKVYYTGEEHPNIDDWVDPETNEWDKEPIYPEQIEYLTQLIKILKNFKDLIDQFKSELV